MAVDSMAEQLRGTLQCEDLLACFYGLNLLDTACFWVTVDAVEPLTIDEIAAAVDRERSTVYRSVQRLLQTGLLDKQQVNYESGSYCHVYVPADSGAIAGEMRRLLNEWYAQTDQLIQEFAEKYGTDTLTTADSTAESACLCALWTTQQPEEQ